MSKVTDFLAAAGTFYLATDDDGQPRVRPFGAVAEFDGRIYLCTNNTKPCFRQMTQNPRVEVSAASEGRWIRIAGELIPDPRPEAKAAMLAANPVLTSMYSVDDGIFEVLFFQGATATISSFAGVEETIAL